MAAFLLMFVSQVMFNLTVGRIFICKQDWQEATPGHVREQADELIPPSHITLAVYFCTKPHISTCLEHSFQINTQIWLGFMYLPFFFFFVFCFSAA